MSSQKKNVSAAAVIVCVALCLLAACFSLYFSITGFGSIVSAFSAGYTDTGTFQLKVLDGSTKKPVQNASVVLPITGKTYATDVQGQTPDISVPILTDSRFDGIQKQDWGDVCVIVYADGYIPYALFDMQVQPNKKRTGPTVLIFQKGTTQTDDPFNIVEAPERVWVNALVEKYNPKPSASSAK
ncbi:MAG: hypothetical protein WCP73_00970 [Eubacteriales bacterium]